MRLGRFVLPLVFILLLPPPALSDDAERIASIYQGLRIKQHREAISDYGQIYQSTEGFFEIQPRDADEVSKMVALSQEHDIPLRIRGNGHTINGSSLPQSGEILLQTEKLRHFHFSKEGTITAGAGAQVLDIEEKLNQYGYRLPIINGGGPGPSLGGFISAGGLADGSEKFGGFWETVKQVTIIGGTGEPFTLDPTHELFPWLPGSFGQFGVIVEATLQIIPKDDVTPTYPLGKRGALRKVRGERVYETEAPASRAGFRSVQYWFGYLVPTDQRWEAQRKLKEFTESYAQHFLFSLVAQRNIKNRSIVPPLIYPRDEDYTVLEIHGIVNPSSDKTRARLVEFERGFMEMAMENGYRRYPQVEYLEKDFDFKRYFGEKIYYDFLDMKKIYDPDFIFNRGTIFKHPYESRPVERKTRKAKKNKLGIDLSDL